MVGHELIAGVAGALTALAVLGCVEKGDTNVSAAGGTGSQGGGGAGGTGGQGGGGAGGTSASECGDSEPHEHCFSRRQEIPLARPFWLSVADVDADGDRDVVSVSMAGLDVLKQPSPGKLDPPAHFAFALEERSGATSADLDGDGIDDIAFRTKKGVEWLRNDGGGQFTTKGVLSGSEFLGWVPVPPASPAWGIGPMGSSGLFTFGATQTPQLATWQEGAWLKQELPDFGPPDTHDRTLPVGDFAGDNTEQVVLRVQPKYGDAGGPTGPDQWLFVSPSGAPPWKAMPVEEGSWMMPAWAVRADVDGDGGDELLYVRQEATTSAVRVLKHGIQSTEQVILDYELAGIVAGDFDADGDVDAAIAGHKLTVLLNDGTGKFHVASIYSDFAWDRRPYALSAGMLDGDGKADLVVGTVDGRLVVFWSK